MWLPRRSDAEQLAEPVVSGVPMSPTETGPQRVVAPSMNDTFAVRMSPGSASPKEPINEPSRTVARKRIVALVSPPEVA